MTETGQHDRQRTECHTQHDPEEERGKVRRIQFLGRVTEGFRDLIHRFGFAYYRQTVTHLQAQVRRSQQFNTGTTNTRDSDVKRFTHLQIRDTLAVNLGFGNDDMTADEMDILLFLFPYHFGLGTQEKERLFILEITYEPHFIAYMQDRIGIRHLFGTATVDESCDDDIHMRE